MLFNIHSVIPELQPYIKVISSIELSKSDQFSFRVLPDACTEIFITYKNKSIATVKCRNEFSSGGSFVTSRMTTFMDVVMKPDSGCIAICFYPGKAHHFFSFPMSELADKTICIHELWSSSYQLENSVDSCSDNDERAEVIQHFILSLLRKSLINETFNHCLWQINFHRGLLSVNELAKDVNISQRQLSRQFNKYAGLSPKEFSRVNRFISALSNIKKNATDNLTGIAYESGYYDQSHFIHEFKEFTGVSPKELIAAQDIIY